MHNVQRYQRIADSTMFLHQETAVTEDDRTIEWGRGLSRPGSARGEAGGKIDRSRRSLAFAPRCLPFFYSGTLIGNLMAQAQPPLTRFEEIKCFVGAGLAALTLAGLVIWICFLIAGKI